MLAQLPATTPPRVHPSRYRGARSLPSTAERPWAASAIGWLALLLLFLGLTTTSPAQTPANLAFKRPTQVDSLRDYMTGGVIAVDGLANSSAWFSGSNAFPHWIEVDLGQNAVLTGVRIVGGQISSTQLRPKTYQLQHWDGATWQTFDTGTALGTQDFRKTFASPSLVGRRVRLLATEGEGIRVGISELELLGTPHTLQLSTSSPLEDGVTALPGAPLQLVFNRPISAGVLGGIVLLRASDNSPVSGTTSLAATGGAAAPNTLVFTPTAPLAWDTAYQVRIAAGTVTLRTDSSIGNGPIDFRFRVTPQLPRATPLSDQLAAVTDPFVLVFDRPVTLLDANRIRIENLETGALLSVTGLVPSDGGRHLTLEHAGTLSKNRYLVSLDEGAVEDALSGSDNAAQAVPFYSGRYILAAADFVTGLGDWRTATDLGFNTTNNARWFRFNTSVPGPGGDYSFVSQGRNDPGDFVASPGFHVEAGRSYVFTATVQQNFLRALLSDTRSIANATTVASIDAPPPDYDGSYEFDEVQGLFTATSSGTRYLLFQGFDPYLNKDTFLDDIVIREVVPPAVKVTSPDTQSVFREGETITLAAEAFGFSGALAKVEFFDGDTLLATRTSAPFSLARNNYLPGTRVFRIVATDVHGGTTTQVREVQINFADGTYNDYRQFTFDADNEGWTGVDRRNPDPSGSGFEIQRRAATAASGANPANTAITSPRIFLFAGQTYIVQFRARRAGSQAVTLALAVRTSPGEPAASEALASWSLSSTETLYSHSFTVTADGAYHLSFFQPGPTISNQPNIVIDDVRLIGSFNNAPSVTLTTPAAGLRTVAGALVTLAATASDTDGTVAEVAFRRGQVTLGADNTAPFVYNWAKVPEGTHAITAVARDSAGGDQTSASVSFEARPNHFSVATYIGGASDDEAVRGSVFQSDGTLVLAGYADLSAFGAAFPNVAPVYLNGAAPGQRGFVARFSPDGRTLLSLTVVGDRVLDLARDAQDNLYVAAHSKGFLKLNPAASQLLWSYAVPSGRYVHRVDATASGLAVGLSTTTAEYEQTHVGSLAQVFVVGPEGTLLGTMSGAGQNTTDLVIDEARRTVWFCGWKNIIAIDDSGAGSNPVDIPILLARSLGSDPANPALEFGAVRIRAYDWENRVTSPNSPVDPVLDARWLNRPENNMADTYGERLHLGPDGFLYFLSEVDGGNHPLRYSPFDIMTKVPIVGGDAHHVFATTATEPKLAITRHDPATGDVLATQLYTNRRLNGSGSSVFARNTGFAVDSAGRVHIAGACASGLATDTDFLPGDYSGGAYYLVLSPDLTTREFVGRLSSNGANYTVALGASGRVALAGNSGAGAFTHAPFQAALAAGSANDGFFAVGQLDRYFKFQVGAHPRLAFNADEIPGLRARLSRSPYSDLRQTLLDYLADTNLHEVIDPSYDQGLRAQVNAFLYVLTGEDAYAQTARSLVEQVLVNPSYGWANPSAKGLASFWIGTRVAFVYDWCVNAPSWDGAFDYRVSKALVQMGEMIVDSGGTEQNTETSSNWQGARGAAGGLCLLATDHGYSATKLSAAYDRVRLYLDANLGNDASTRGWNPEGTGYHFFPVGNYVGPFGIAMARHDPARNIANHIGFQRSFWASFAGIHTGMNIWGAGGAHPDWADDNPGVRGEGTYGLAFHYLPASLKPAARWAYDRFQGSQGAHRYVNPANETRPIWDIQRAGAIWTYLYYPESDPAADPAENHQAQGIGLDTGAQGIGLFTFRNSYDYHPETDVLAQFNARTRFPGGHNGPDGLGFRLISHGTAWVVGGGRNNPGKKIGQATLYKSFPTSASVIETEGLGSILGTPLLRPDGGGHVVARMALSNTGVAQHTRRFTASYDSAATGAAAAFVIADTSTDGLFWHLPTYFGNSVTVGANTFTITAPGGATLRGTVLHPANPVITTGVQERGSGYGTDSTGSDVVQNRYVSIGGADGSYLVVLTIQPAGGPPHPVVTRASGAVADAVVQIGSLNLAHQPEDILYNGAAYVAPSATVTFAAGANGSLSGAPVSQTVAYGGAATAPAVTPAPGWVFLGWDKPFDAVVKSMAVTARYAAVQNVPAAPSLLVAKTVSATHIDLSWQDNSVGETGFVLERSLDGGSTWQALATLGANLAAYDDAGLAASTTYAYRVKAAGAGGDSAWSSIAFATTGAANALATFTTTPPLVAHQGLRYTYNVLTQDPDTGFPALTAAGLPAWLTWTDNGNGTGTLTGIPGPADNSPVVITLAVDDGVNDPVRQTFTLAINRPPVVTITAPTSRPVNIPAGVGLLVAATASDETPGALSYAWSLVSGPGSATFENPDAAATAVSFGADGVYLLRLVVSDGFVTGVADLLVHRGTAHYEQALERRTLVNFGGTSYVGSNQSLPAGTLFTGQEWGNDALNNDAVNFRAPSDTVPIIPAANYTAGTSGVFHGAWEYWNLGTTTPATSAPTINQVINDNTNGDAIQLGTTNSANLRNYALLYWKKSDFLNEGATRNVRLVGNARLSLTINNNAAHNVVRFAVRQAGQWYVSRSSSNVAGVSTFELTDWAAERWAPYTPGTTPGSLRANGTGAASALVFSAVNLTNVDAVGLYTEATGTVGANNRTVQVRAFTVQGQVEVDPNVAPTVTASASSAGIGSGAVTLTGTRSDDGRPAPPGAVSLQWRQLAGPGALALSGATTLNASATGALALGAYRFRLEASDGGVATFADTSWDANAQPVLVQTPSVPGSVAGTSVALAALADDANNPESTLVYTWSVENAPAGASVDFSANGTNAAKASVAGFTRPGAYTLRLTVTDPHGGVVSATFAANVAATPTSLALTPASASVPVGGTRAFTASVTDQFGLPIVSPSLAWSLSGGGTVGTGGVFTAGAQAGGPHTLTVTAGAVQASATLAVTDTAPTVSDLANLTMREGKSTGVLAFTVGDAETAASALAVTAISSNSALVAPSGIVLGGSGATRTLTVNPVPGQTGTATITVNVGDGAFTTTDTFVLTVQARAATTIKLTPLGVVLSPTQTRTFAAVVRDQDGDALPVQPALTWTATGGTITPSGFYTAGPAVGAYTVTAQSGAISASGAINIVNTPPALGLLLPATPWVSLPDASVSLRLAVTAADAETAATVLWTQVSAPSGGAATFDDTTATDTVVRFSATGTYVLRVTASDGAATSRIDFTIGVGVPLEADGETKLLQLNFRDGTDGDASTGLIPADLGSTWTTLTSKLNTTPSTDPELGDLRTNENRLSGIRLVWTNGFAFASSSQGEGGTGGAGTATDGLSTYSASGGVRFTDDRAYTIPWSVLNSYLGVSQATDGYAAFRLESATRHRFSFWFASSFDSNNPSETAGWVGLFNVGGTAGPLANGQISFSGGSTLTLNATSRQGDDTTPDSTGDTTLKYALGTIANRFPSFNGETSRHELLFQIGDGSSTNNGAVLNALVIEATVLGTANTAPAVTLAPAHLVAPGETLNLAGAVSDPDNLPALRLLSSAWRVVSGPGPVVFGDVNSPATTATFPNAGVYVLRLSANDEHAETSRDTVVTVTTVTPPLITAQPSAQIVNPGGSANFSVAASGVALVYQWRRDGSVLADGGAVSGSSTSTLTLAGVGAAEAGNYDCVVTNPAGSATSAPAGLVLNTAPLVAITSPTLGALSLPLRANSLVLAATVTDAQSTPTLAWSRVSGPGTATFANPASANTSVSFSADGAYVLRLSADDGLLVTTREFTVIVGATGGAGPLAAQLSTNFSQNVTNSTVDRLRFSGDNLDKSVAFTGAGENAAALLWTVANAAKVDFKSVASVAYNGFTWGLPSDPIRYGSVFATGADFGYVIGGSNSTLRYSGATATEPLVQFHSGVPNSGAFNLVFEVKSGEVLGNLGVKFRAGTAGTTGVWQNNSALQNGAYNVSVHPLDSNGLAGTGFAFYPTKQALGAGAGVSVSAVDQGGNTLGAGAYLLRIQFFDKTRNERYSIDDVAIEGSLGLPLAPQVNPGPAPAATAGQAATLSGLASAASTWSVVSGPGMVTFANAASADTSVTFSVAGSYTLRLGASDGKATVFQDLVVSVDAPVTPYVSWLADHDLIGALSAPGDDPDGDGVANLLEYALSGNPRSGSSAPVPLLGRVDSGGESRLTLTFTRHRAELNYVVEGSDNLTRWAVVATNPGAVGELVTVTDNVAPSAGRRFLRLRVTAEP